MKIFFAFALSLPVFFSCALAGEADVTDARAKETSPGVFRFTVTVFHKDEGWEHYADRWEILGPDDVILATRVLTHPHVHEQPFTRAMDDVRLPTDVHNVTIRAHDSVHGYGGKTFRLSIRE